MINNIVDVKVWCIIFFNLWLFCLEGRSFVLIVEMGKIMSFWIDVFLIMLFESLDGVWILDVRLIGVFLVEEKVEIVEVGVMIFVDLFCLEVVCKFFIWRIICK